MTLELNLIASILYEMSGLPASTIGWIFIALVWLLIEALWVTGGYLTAQRASPSTAGRGKQSWGQKPELRNYNTSSSANYDLKA